MKQIQYDGFELEHFDSAFNFRKYQISLIKDYLYGSLLEVGAGKGGLAVNYINLLDDVTLIEPDKNLYNFLKKKFKKKLSIKNQSIRKVKNKFDVVIYFDVLEHIKKDFKEIFSKDPLSFNFYIYDLIDLVNQYQDFEETNKVYAGEFSNSKISSGLLKRETYLKKVLKNNEVLNISSCSLNEL